MAKPKPCINTNCSNLVKNYKATQCWECYIRSRPLPKTAFKKGQNIGDKHPRWTGGKWCWARREVLKRDDYTCQICGLREPEIMDVAHKEDVKGDQNRRYTVQDLNNLFTACPNDHRRFDNQKRNSKILLIANLANSANPPWNAELSLGKEELSSQ